MESAVHLAERLTAQFEDRLSRAAISDEILTALGDAGLRIGDPVPNDVAAEALDRLEAAAAPLTTPDPAAARVVGQRWPFLAPAR